MKNIDLEAVACEHDNLFSQKITELLDYRKITIKKLAEYIGKTSNTVANWKHKRSQPSASDIHFVSLVTEMHLEYFFKKGMKPEEADLTIAKRTEEDAFFFFRKMLFPDSRNFSQERIAISDIITRLDEENIPSCLKLLQLIESDFINKK